MTIAAAGPGAAQVFIELGAVALVLAALATLAGRLGITAIPFYLVGGLAVGEGGIAPLDVSEEFISVVAEIGVLLLLLTLGLEYSADELRYGLRTGLRPGLLDAAANFAPGFAAGLVLGWEIPAAVLLGGATWVSSSGIAAKVLADLDRLGNRETRRSSTCSSSKTSPWPPSSPSPAPSSAGRNWPAQSSPSPWPSLPPPRSSRSRSATATGSAVCLPAAATKRCFWPSSD
jgi:hypothetical protein